MARSPSRRSTTRRGALGIALGALSVLSVLSILSVLGACVSPGSPPGSPGSGPAGTPPLGRPRLSLGGSRRVVRYTEAIKQISLRGGRLGWGGLTVGMSYHDAELVTGRKLPPLGDVPRDMLCGYSAIESELMGLRLGLDFDSHASEGHLKAIWLPLASSEGDLSTPEIAAALKARFPKLRYVPSPHAPDLAESANPRPLYQIENGAMFFVDPRRGIYFGEICVD